MDHYHQKLDFELAHQDRFLLGCCSVVPSLSTTISTYKSGWWAIGYTNLTRSFSIVYWTCMCSINHQLSLL